MVWLHVIAAAVWIGVNLCVVVAGAIITPDSAEFRSFGLRVLPITARANLVAAAVVFLTGVFQLANLMYAASFRLPAAFWTVIGAKTGLFALMVGVAWHSYAATRRNVGSQAYDDVLGKAFQSLPRRVTVLTALSTAAGICALALGIWLVGGCR